VCFNFINGLISGDFIMKNMLKNIMFAVAIGAIVVPSNTLDACNMCKRAREHNKNVKKVIGCVAGTTAALSAVAVALDWYLELGYITPYMQAGLEKAMPYLEDAYQQLPEMPESVKILCLKQVLSLMSYVMLLVKSFQKFLRKQKVLLRQQVLSLMNFVLS